MQPNDNSSALAMLSRQITVLGHNARSAIQQAMETNSAETHLELLEEALNLVGYIVSTCAEARGSQREMQR